MKRESVTNISIVGLVILALSSSSALAQQCPPGQVPTTIINLAGKAVEICVGEEALPHIGQEGIMVIPGVCQCFSQEAVQTALDSDPDLSCQVISGSTHLTHEACTLAECLNGALFRANEGPPDESTSGQCRYPTGQQTAVNNFCDSDNVGPLILTEAEAAACVAILRTFVIE